MDHDGSISRCIRELDGPLAWACQPQVVSATYYPASFEVVEPRCLLEVSRNACCFLRKWVLNTCFFDLGMCSNKFGVKDVLIHSGFLSTINYQIVGHPQYHLCKTTFLEVFGYLHYKIKGNTKTRKKKRKDLFYDRHVFRVTNYFLVPEQFFTFVRQAW